MTPKSKNDPSCLRILGTGYTNIHWTLSRSTVIPEDDTTCPTSTCNFPTPQSNLSLATSPLSQTLSSLSHPLLCIMNHTAEAACHQSSFCKQQFYQSNLFGLLTGEILMCIFLCYIQINMEGGQSGTYLRLTRALPGPRVSIAKTYRDETTRK